MKVADGGAEQHGDAQRLGWPGGRGLQGTGVVAVRMGRTCSSPPKSTIWLCAKASD